MAVVYSTPRRVSPALVGSVLIGIIALAMIACVWVLAAPPAGAVAGFDLAPRSAQITIILGIGAVLVLFIGMVCSSFESDR